MSNDQIRANVLKDQADRLAHLEAQRELREAEANKRAADEAASIEEEWKKHISAPGELKGVTGLLDERRAIYAIPDEMFQVNAAFDRILVHQIIEEKENKELAPGSEHIIAPKSALERAEQETPRAVLVSAGLLALDVLRSNGYRLGDIIHFVELQPYRRPVAIIAHKTVYMMTLNVGDICDNEDFRARVQAGEMSIELNENQQHVVHENGQPLPTPMNPWAGADMP